MFADIETILQDFPKFELSYETMIHKKVYDADLLLAIPEGQKCFAWFTSYKEDNVCFIMEITDHNKINNIKIVVTSFADSLSLGTILYGSVFQYNKINCFSIEDIYYYKGKSYQNKSYAEKLEKLSEMVKKEMAQNVYTPNFTIFGLPLLGKDFNLLVKEIETLPYKIDQIKFRYFNNKKIVFVKYFRPNTNTNTNTNMNTNTNIRTLSKAIFKILPDVEPDIYHLFLYKNGQEEYYDIAFIPDFKTSVMMNKLFRNIKENDNLDALEESDDEAEFEDPRQDKYVFLDRSFKMNCDYNVKFKRWMPVSLAEKRDKIVTFNELNMSNHRK
jgi:hypothetical protein